MLRRSLLRVLGLLFCGMLLLVGGCSDKKDSNTASNPGGPPQPPPVSGQVPEPLGAPKGPVAQSFVGPAGNQTVVEARALRSQREFQAALELIDRALEQDPDGIDLHREYQDTMRAMGGQEAALRQRYEDLAKAHADSALYQYLYGRSIIKEDPNAAEAAFRKAIELDPKFVWSYLAMGTLRSQRGDNFAAVQTYEKAIAIFPDSPELHFNLAEARFNIGAYRTALEAAEKTIALNPDFAVAHELTGRIHFTQGDLGEARKSLERALAINPNLPQANLAMAEIAFKDGDVTSARAYAGKALQGGATLPPALKAGLGIP